MEQTIDQLENGTAMDQIIEIKSIFKTAGKHIIQPAYNSHTGWWAGVDRYSEEEKKTKNYFVTVGDRLNPHLNTKIVLKDGLFLDLRNEIDRINWNWLKECPEIAMSYAEAQGSKALFYIHMEGRESETTNKKTESRFEAMQLVMNDPATNYENRALLLNMDMEGERPSVIKEFLLDKAQKDPQAIVRIYRNKSMKINLLYLKAKKANKITVNPLDSVIKYGGQILGLSDEAAIAFLQSNEDVLELLEREVNPEYFQEQIAKADTKLTPVQKAQAARMQQLDEQKDK